MGILDRISDLWSGERGGVNRREDNFEIGQKVWCKIKGQGDKYYFEPVVIEDFNEKESLFTVVTKTNKKYQFSLEALRRMEIKAASDNKGSAEDMWNGIF